MSGRYCDQTNLNVNWPSKICNLFRLRGRHVAKSLHYVSEIQFLLQNPACHVTTPYICQYSYSARLKSPTPSNRFIHISFTWLSFEIGNFRGFLLMPFHTFFFFHIRGRASGDMCFVPHIKKAYHCCRMMNIFIAVPLFLIHYSSSRWYRECMCSVIATLGHWLFHKTRLHVNIYA